MNKSKQITSKQKTIWRIAALAVAGALVVAACGDSGSADATADLTEAPAAATTFAPVPGGDDQGGADEAEAPGLGSGGVGQPAQAPIETGRDIIFTATMTVSVDDVAGASTEAVRIVESFRGFIFGQQSVSDPEPATVLVFKVPPEQFQDVLAALGDVGEIRNQNVSADDVTDRIVDLASRISTAEASVERLRTLLEQADAIKTITELETQLLARETSLEQLRGSLRTLENQVASATITVTITQAVARPAINVQPTAYLGFDDAGTSCPGDAGIRVVEGETVTFCLEIFNVGDTALTEIELKDAVIGKELGDFVVVFGDMSSPLEPGQSIVLATSLELERTLRTQTRVTATPLNEDGTVIEGRTVANTSTITLAAQDPGGIPGFSEGLERSWEVLINLVKVLILAAGIALPFIWLIGIAWLYVRWRRSRHAERAAARERAGAMARASRETAVPVTPGGETVEESDDDAWDLEDDV